MKKYRITFFLSHKKIFFRNMEIIKSGFRKKNTLLEMNYLGSVSASRKVQNGLGESVNQRQALAIRKKYAGKDKVLMCCDLSLASQMKGLPKAQQRILIAEPNDFCFKNIYEFEKGLCEEKKDLSVFTDIVFYNNYFEEQIRRCFLVRKNINKLHDAGIPCADMLNDSQVCLEYRKAAEKIFPQLNGKKIISIISQEKESGISCSRLLSLDLKKLVSLLPEDWIIFSNNPMLGDKCADLPSDMRNRVIYFNSRIYDPGDVAFITDILISDVAELVCDFSARKLPFYIINYMDSYFYQYIAEKYPELELHTFLQLPEIIRKNTLTDEQIAFCSKFAPVSTGKSIEDLYRLAVR